MRPRQGRLVETSCEDRITNGKARRFGAEHSATIVLDMVDKRVDELPGGKLKALHHAQSDGARSVGTIEHIGAGIEAVRIQKLARRLEVRIKKIVDE